MIGSTGSEGMGSKHRTTTICYKVLDGATRVCFDVWVNQATLDLSSPNSNIPAVVYFHAGGLTVGNKSSYIPLWLRESILDIGCVFISPDYQLLPPSSGHDLVQDIQDLWRHLATNVVTGFSKPLRVDMTRTIVAGSSAGGLCAYLAVMHCTPKPKALFSIYGMGGNFLVPHYFKPKTEPFFRGRELLDPADFSDFTYPFTDGPLSAIVDSPLRYHPQTHFKPGYPANPRMLLARLYLQQGTWLDYYTGAHEPSLSDALLRAARDESENLEVAVAQEYRQLFPQFHVDASWPPTLLFHGTGDTAVPVDESRYMKALLHKAGVPVQLFEFDGQEHSFDFQAVSEERYQREFDIAREFLCRMSAP